MERFKEENSKKSAINTLPSLRAISETKICNVVTSFVADFKIFLRVSEFYIKQTILSH